MQLKPFGASLVSASLVDSSYIILLSKKSGDRNEVLAGRADGSSHIIITITIIIIIIITITITITIIITIIIIMIMIMIMILIIIVITTIFT